jgi:hypothetical protein
MTAKEKLLERVAELSEAEADEAAVAEADADFAAGRTVSLEELEQKYGVE